MECGNSVYVTRRFAWGTTGATNVATTSVDNTSQDNWTLSRLYISRNFLPHMLKHIQHSVCDESHTLSAEMFTVERDRFSLNTSNNSGKPLITRVLASLSGMSVTE